MCYVESTVCVQVYTMLDSNDDDSVNIHEFCRFFDDDGVYEVDEDNTPVRAATYVPVVEKTDRQNFSCAIVPPQPRTRILIFLRPGSCYPRHCILMVQSIDCCDPAGLVSSTTLSSWHSCVFRVRFHAV